MISRRVRVEVYLEGIKIPFYEAHLTIAPHVSSQLTLSVPPVRRFFDILPRTIVQVYYEMGEGWRTFFEGEVISHGFSKTAQGGRSMVLHCKDLSNTWEYAYAYFVNNENVDSVSLTDDITHFTGVSRIFDKSERERLYAVRGIGQKSNQLMREKDVVMGIRNVFALVKDVNEFYAKQFSKFALDDRLFNLPDDQIRHFFDAQNTDMLQFHLNNQQSFASLLYCFSVILQSVYQGFWSIPNPSVNPETGKPVNFLFLPVTLLTAPPTCNVIFPDLHEGFEYDRPYLVEPTRLELFIGSDAATIQFFEAPAEFRAKIEEIRKDQAKNKDTRTQNLLIESDNPELDERRRGVIPTRQSIQQDVYASIRRAKVEAAGKDEKKVEEAKAIVQRMMLGIADFEFLLGKFRNRTLNVTMPFNPNIHPSFPILLLDKEARIFGSPVGLTHTLSSQGSAKSHVSCAYARHKDIIGDVISEPPPWINKSYDPHAIGEDTFQFTDYDGKQKTVAGAFPLITGTRSVLSRELPVYNGDGEEMKKPSTQEEAADLLFDMYLNSGDRETFVTEYTRREVMTKEQSLAILGAEEANEEELTGALFDDERRVVIQDVKALLLGSGYAIAEI